MLYRNFYQKPRENFQNWGKYLIIFFKKKEKYKGFFYAPGQSPARWIDHSIYYSDNIKNAMEKDREGNRDYWLDTREGKHYTDGKPPTKYQLMDEFLLKKSIKFFLHQMIGKSSIRTLHIK